MSNLRDLIITTSREYVSRHLANHFERSLGSDSEVISTVLIMGIGTIVWAKAGPPKSVVVRNFRNWCAPLCVFGMGYRAVTGERRERDGIFKD